MRIRDYTTQIQEIKNLFKDINFSIEEIEAKIPEERKNNEMYPLRKISTYYENLKTDLQSLTDALSDDTKTDEDLEQLFGNFRRAAGTVYYERESFRSFLKERNFEDIHIAGMSSMYKLIDASNAARRVCERIEKLKVVDDVEAGFNVYKAAHQDYIDSKHAFVEKHKGKDLNGLEGRVNRARTALTLAEQEATHASREHRDGLDASNEAEKRKNNLLTAIRNQEITVEKYVKQTKKYKSLLEKIELNTHNSRDQIKKLEEEVTKKQNQLAKLDSMFVGAKSEFDKRSAEFDSFTQRQPIHKENINLQRRAIHLTILQTFLSTYCDNFPNMEIKDLPVHFRELLDKEFDYENEQQKLKNILAGVTKALSATAGKLDVTDIEFANQAFSEYRDTAISFFNFEVEYDIAQKQLHSMQKRIGDHKTHIETNIRAYQNQKDLEFIRESARNELEFMDPLQFEAKLKEMAKTAKEEEFSAKKQLNTKKKKLEDEEKYLAELSSQLDFTRTKRSNAIEAEKTAAAAHKELKEQLDELQTLRDKYTANIEARDNAIWAYRNNSRNLQAYDLDEIKEDALKLLERADDAKGNHENSDEFNGMVDALRNLSTVTGGKDAYRQKLEELQEAARVYKKAKTDQHRLFPTALRKTRLAYVDGIAEFAKIGLVNLEKGTPEYLQNLENQYNQLDEKAKNKKAKSESQFNDAMSKKVQVPGNESEEKLNEEKVNEADLGMESK